MSEEKPKVLIVEDDKAWSELIRRGLGDKVLILFAHSLAEGEEVFRKNLDIDLIIMDACVPGDKPNAQFLVRDIRKTFTGPIIAMSSMPTYRKVLLAAGCDYEVEEKAQAAKKALELLGIS